MTLQLLCRNRITDYERFRGAFLADLDRAGAAGLRLRALWREVDAPEEVHFLFDADDRHRAEAFMTSPESAASGEQAGVVDGDYHWLEPLDLSGA